MGGGLEKKPGSTTLPAASADGDVGAAPGKRTLTEELSEHARGPMRVTANGLNVRSSPSKSGRDNIIGALHQDARVEADGHEGDWVKIGFRSRLGFVFGGYVAPVAPHAPHAAHEATAHAPPAPVHAPDPEHLTPHAPVAEPAATTGKPVDVKPATPSPSPTPEAPKPTPKPEAHAAETGSGHLPPPLDHMGKFVYEVSAGGATQQVLVYVAAGQLTLTPDVFVFLHGQWANYGIDPKQLAARKAAEQARIARETADPNRDPKKKVHGDETDAYVESGRDSSAEAMQHAQGKNVISILPQGVMGGGGSTGGHMGVLTAKGGGLPALVDAVMTHLQTELHGDKLKPGRISLAGHSAGGYMGVHEALANAGDLRDAITDVTLMDAEYNGAQFADSSAWLLQGKHGKSFRIVASPGQLKTGRHLEHFGPAGLKKHAEAAGYTVVDKGGVGDARGPSTVVVYHAQVMKGSDVHADVLILNNDMEHHHIRDNVMDDAILNIGQGAHGGGDTFGTMNHGVPAGGATGKPAPSDAAPASGKPASTADVKPAAAASKPTPKPTAAAAPSQHHDDSAHAPQHNPDPKAPETPGAPPRIAVPSNSASKAIYDSGGALHVSHLTHGKGNALNEEEFEFKKRVYQAAIDARMTQKIFGGLADEDLGTITGVPMPEPQRYRKILMPSLMSLLSAMDAAAKAGTPAGAKKIPPTDYKGIGVVSGYRGPKEEIALWDRYFQGYLVDTAHAREATHEPFGNKARDLMVNYIASRKAAPGHSNHSNGTAVDLWALSKTHEIHNAYGNQVAWRASWHYAWLLEHAASFNFRNYDKEAWHWEYMT
jgi:hypothetical protein